MKAIMPLPSWIIPTGLVAIVGAFVWSKRTKEDAVENGTEEEIPIGDATRAPPGADPRSLSERLRERGVPFVPFAPPPVIPLAPPGGAPLSPAPASPAGPCLETIIGFDGVRRRGQWVPYDSPAAQSVPFRAGEKYVRLPDGRMGRCI